MKFYGPVEPEVELCANKFIEEYSTRYYADSEGYKPPNSKRVVNRTSKYVEKLIDKYAYGDVAVESENDVVGLLAWKTGGIKHKPSEDTIVFGGTQKWNWDILEEASSFKEIHPKGITFGKKEFDFGSLLNFIREYYENADPEKFLRDTLEIRGMGPVYAITLLYFASKGVYPIYDQFVDRALWAIENDKIPGSCNCDVQFNMNIYSVDSSKRAYRVLQKLEGYKKEIAKLCNDIDPKNGYECYRSCRNIDRALWVYGHAFKSSSYEKSVC